MANDRNVSGLLDTVVKPILLASPVQIEVIRVSGQTGHPTSVVFLLFFFIGPLGNYSPSIADISQ